MLKKLLKNKYTRNSIIVLIVTIALLFIDLMLKHFLYDSVKASDWQTHYGQGQYDWNIKIIAGRSLLHTSTTFLDFIGGSLPKWASLLINFSIAILFITMALFSKSKSSVIGLAITLAGIFGNTIDNIFDGGVRDIFVTPWWDRGTFNLADILVVVGAVTTGISYFLIAFKKA